ncbi:hypothetical protein B0H16DRAFT_1471734 [Mycena metata]|uniref:Uncharacterized protein n=1 Tax=Mycena metata TaxID=1033252 RepID=A0AAD7HQ88_9AGAR|nr:hypothetical protein B0H16DRAFT_1471734 [Mycena metata]
MQLAAKTYLGSIVSIAALANAIVVYGIPTGEGIPVKTGLANVFVATIDPAHIEATATPPVVKERTKKGDFGVPIRRNVGWFRDYNFELWLNFELHCVPVPGNVLNKIRRLPGSQNSADAQSRAATGADFQADQVRSDAEWRPTA